MQPHLALLCSLLVSLPATGNPAAPNDPSGPSPKVKERLAKATPGSIVEVVRTDRERLRGRLMVLGENGIEIQHCKNRKLALQTVPLTEIRSLKIHRNGILIPEQRPVQPWALLEQTTLIPQGRAVVIRHNSKGKLTGQLGALEEAEFELRTVGGAGVTSLRYDEVRSIEVDDGGRDWLVWLIVPGAVVALGVVMAYLVPWH